MSRTEREDRNSIFKLYNKQQAIKPSGQPLTYIAIYEEAKLKKQWIYDPEIKRWQNPEEFLEQQKRISGGLPDRFSKLQVRDPQEGLEAADKQIQSIMERKAILTKRIIEYYKVN